MDHSLSTSAFSRNDRILGGLWGALVGDALGVPVEFRSRADVQSNPVKEMRAHGSHDQPKGTWSDDGALILCTVDSLLHQEFDTEDMGKRFVAWSHKGFWSARGIVFDIGNTTARALGQIANGIGAEVAGGDSESSNGNGSLMRILPIVLRFSELPSKILLDRIHRAFSITHRHPRSQMSCGFYSLVIRELLRGFPPRESYGKALGAFRSFYEHDSYWAVELDDFQPLLSGMLATSSEPEINSSGYVVDTLTASLWCLLTASNYHDCVLKAVNLGGDTDTTGCVAGGLAGVTYGIEGVPKDWVRELPRQPELNDLFAQFAKLNEING